MLNARKPLYAHILQLLALRSAFVFSKRCSRACSERQQVPSAVFANQLSL